jgi:hypothetical protein
MRCVPSALHRDSAGRVASKKMAMNEISQMSIVTGERGDCASQDLLDRNMSPFFRSDAGFYKSVSAGDMIQRRPAGVEGSEYFPSDPKIFRRREPRVTSFFTVPPAAVASRAHSHLQCNEPSHPTMITSHPTF